MARDPIHPGRFLADELEALEMSVPEVAEVLHVPANRIYQLLKLYELRLAEQQAGEKIKRTVVRRATVQAA